jgi:hypothetical protein
MGKFEEGSKDIPDIDPAHQTINPSQERRQKLNPKKYMFPAALFALSAYYTFQVIRLKTGVRIEETPRNSRELA